MRLRITALGSLLFCAVTACGGEAKVKHAPDSLLASARIVAVTEIRVTNTMGDNLFALVSRQISELIFDESTAGEDFEARFSEYLISTVNRNLLDRGFSPIQRMKIRQVENEQAYQQTGLTKNAVQLGELLGANAVFTGQLSIRREGGLDYPLILACFVPPILIIPRPHAEVVFSGELTDVRTGALLASGTSSDEMNNISVEEINAIIENWFDELPAL